MSCLNRFKGWCQENFPFIEDDFNAITDYQLMCKLKEYVVSIGNDVANLEIDYNELAGKIVELEEIVNSMDGEFDDLVEEFNSLKTLVESYNMRIQANANRIEQVNTNLQQLISLNINEVKDLINELKDYVDDQDTLILAEISTINNNIILIRKDIEVIAQGIPRVRDTGTIITLNDTIKDAPIDIKLDPSELSQEREPTPESPQDVHVISGDNSVVVSNSDNTLTQVKPLNLGDLEYCKIGTYSDHFFKATDGDSIYDTLDSTTKESLVSGKWYMFKRLPYKVFNGNENWGFTFYADYFRGNINVDDIIQGLTINDIELYSNYFYGANGAISGVGVKPGMMAHYRTNTAVYFVTEETTIADWKNWLSSHNVKLYYRLNTPKYILLNDTLQQQLDDIYETLKAYDEQTNITQINHDLPFIMTAITMKKGSVTDEV